MTPEEKIQDLKCWLDAERHGDTYPPFNQWDDGYNAAIDAVLNYLNYLK